MLKIGITGGIGSGKTTVAKIVECLGFPVYYADERGKHLTENDPEVLQSIRQFFGNDIFDNNRLNRQALAKIVFSDEEKLRLLNSLIHPAVKRDYETWLNEQVSDLIFSEIAILFESGRYKDFDKNVLVIASEEVRLRRVMRRNGLSEVEIKARMANQWSDEVKLKLADFVINNNEGRGLIQQVIKLIDELD